MNVGTNSSPAKSSVCTIYPIRLTSATATTERYVTSRHTPLAESSDGDTNDTSFTYGCSPVKLPSGAKILSKKISSIYRTSIVSPLCIASIRINPSGKNSAPNVLSVLSAALSYNSLYESVFNA